MGTLDAASFSAMLSSDHGSSSLGSVMTSSHSSCTGPRDHHLFASQYSVLQGSFPFSAAGSGQHLAASKSSNVPAVGYSSAQMPEWPYSRDEQWVFEPSEGTSSTHATNLRSNIIGAPQSLNPPGYGRGSLQRFHSAPSSFLADFNAEDVFAQASSDPLGDGDDDLLAWADNLTPIIERGPQQMDTEKGGASTSLNSRSEQFLVDQTDFESRISTIFTPTQSFGKVEPGSLTRQDGLGGYAMPAIQDNMGRFLPPADSMSGTSEEKYGHGGNSAMQSAYPPDHQIPYLGKEPAGVSSSSGVWNPTTPGILDGNSRLRGMGEITNNEPPGWLGSSSSRPSVGGAALEPARKLGLIRHSSLPVTSRPFGATMDLDDFISADSSTAPNSRTRANRGHATHPRSIAERVRRGKISERMKKLQDLVPNMERQSNTADMLDEVVEYVRQLQLQVQELSNTVDQLHKGLLRSDS